MINPKYYEDIKKFPDQFRTGFELTKDIKVEGDFDRVVLCGMGGSTLYADLANDYLATFTDFRVEVNRGYDLTTRDNEKTLYIVASYSGNTEEVLSVLSQIQEKNYKFIVFTSGGKLLEKAEETGSQFFQIPTGLQPRLSTGYFIGGLFQVLTNQGFIDDKSEEIIKAASKIDDTLDEQKSKDLAKKIKDKVLVSYSTTENSSIARITKIKFNENAKTQSYWNVFPELNHNEMVGYQDVVSNYFFLIFESKFTHERNLKRIDTFVNLMKNKGQDSEVIKMEGENLLEEILNAYYLTDHITFYLAEEKGIDPEPVSMVEDFKKMISE